MCRLDAALALTDTTRQFKSLDEIDVRRIEPAILRAAGSGAELAAKLQRYSGRTDVVVLGLRRGAVPVPLEVAEALDAELDIFLVRKRGMPGHREYAIGAIASGRRAGAE